MKAGEILIDGIFNGSRLLEVPFYQRSYVWSEEQWERFLSDMEFVTKTKSPYFLGSIILKNGQAPNTWQSFSDRKIVIDGQQRLTTLIIFFKVLCLKVGRNDLFDRNFRLEDDTIVLQHGRNDVEAFRRVTDQTKDETIGNVYPPSQIVSAYNYFVQNINASKLDRNIIKQNVQFVCIDLLDGEDEQQVFDTINSLGVRLTTAELLKNYFYHRDNAEEYDRNWAAVFEKDADTRMYWEQELEIGRLKRSLIDIFFDAYFQLFTENRSFNVSAEDKILYQRTDRLSKSYQEFIQKYCGGNKDIVLNSMAEYALTFKRVFNPDYCDMGLPAASGIERINVIIFGLKNSTLIPYVLYVTKNVQDQNELNRIFGVLESYMMRRIVVHASIKNYNRLMTSLILNNVLDADSLARRLSSINDTSTYMPGDNELLEGFVSSKLVNLQTKGILYLIESGIRSPMSSTALLGFNSYSLEHLMPKKWRNNWPECPDETLAQKRDAKLLTLGNLAIIPQSLNASIRDGDWLTKKAGKGMKNPGLDICASGLETIQGALSKDVWNEHEIDLRAQWLWEKARKLWAFPMTKGSIGSQGNYSVNEAAVDPVKEATAENTSVSDAGNNDFNDSFIEEEALVDDPINNEIYLEERRDNLPKMSLTYGKIGIPDVKLPYPYSFKANSKGFCLMNHDRRWLDVKVQIGRVKMFTRLNTETVSKIPGIRRISTALPDYKITDGYKNALYVDNNNAYQVIFKILEIGLGVKI